MENDLFILNNGIKIPKIGFGTWQIQDGEECINSVKWALKYGYRHIDTAVMYRNEKSVGQAVKEFNIERKDVFITTKVPANIKTYKETIEVIEKSLATLDLGYIDLLLIHHPKPWDQRDSAKTFNEENIEVWKAMEEYYKKGLVRAIGVSNFKVSDLKNIIENTEIKPTVNQIRYFIGYTQDEIVNFCKENDILVEAYSPLATGKLLGNEEIERIAKKYNKTLPQIAIRYCLEKDVLPLPKSVHEEYIKQNFDVDFKIEKEDLDYLDSLKFTI